MNITNMNMEMDIVMDMDMDIDTNMNMNIDKNMNMYMHIGEEHGHQCCRAGTTRNLNFCKESEPELSFGSGSWLPVRQKQFTISKFIKLRRIKLVT
jgi:hypothetical protein